MLNGQNKKKGFFYLFQFLFFFAFLPLVPSSITSLIFAFSCVFLRGFFAGGGVYAASGSPHISGYTSLYGFCSSVEIGA